MPFLRGNPWFEVNDFLESDPAKKPAKHVKLKIRQSQFDTAPTRIDNRAHHNQIALRLFQIPYLENY